MALIDFTEFWALDAASGNEPGKVALTMTANGSPGSTTGLFGNCRTFNGSSQWFATPDNAAIGQGNNTWSASAWVYLAAKSATQIFAGKDASGARDHTAFYDVGADRFTMAIFDGTNLITTVAADNFGSPSAATWYSICWGHDATNDLIWIGVNGGTVNTASTGGVAPGDTGNEFRIGSRQYSTFEMYFGGRIQQVVCWNNYRLTDADRLRIYKGGAGMPYPWTLPRAVRGGLTTSLRMHPRLAG